MQLVRYAHPEFSLANDFDRWFRSMFRDFGSFGSPSGDSIGSSADVGLNADLYEADDAFHATFALPGLTREDVKVELSNSVLNVSGHFEDSHGKGGKLSFSRSIAVPEGIKADGIKAKMENGMLSITMPKPEESKPVAIEVN